MWTPYRQVKLHVCHDKDVQLKTCVHMKLLPAVKLLTFNLWLSADHRSAVMLIQLQLE